MRRAGMLCVVLGGLLSGCGGSGRLPVSFLVTCGSSVAEGSIVRLRLNGNDFELRFVEVEADIGTFENLTVDGPELISFDYTAPTFPPGTLGPKTVVFTVRGRPGDVPSTCSVTIHLAPFVTSCATSYPPDEDAAPTTGVYAGTFVVATITGGNFLPGGGLLVQPGGSGFEPLSEIGALAAFSAPGQFRVVNGTTVELTVPDVFSVGAATILDGSPNAGPATMRYLSPFGVLLTEEECFRYVSAFLDFEDFLFELPGSVADEGFTPGLSTPGKVAVGDVNADGVPDVVALAQQSTDAGTSAPEAFLLLADTFGAGLDRDGDGRAPDFAGSFTAQVIRHPDVQTWLPPEARGQNILLSNLDDDAELEIILAALDDEGDHGVLLVDVEAGGTVGALLFVAAPISPDYAGGIAVGDLDHQSPHPDVAVLYGDSDPGARKLVVFGSVGEFDYDTTVYDIPSPYEIFEPGALGAGDFDGDGDDDLIWGQYGGPNGINPEVRAILVAEVDADAGIVGTPQQVENLSGSPVIDIDVFDADGDGKEDALVFIGGEATGDLLEDHLGAGVATFLDALSLRADAYTETPYRIVFWDRAGNGMSLAHADFDGDGVTDLAVVNEFGEVLVQIGRGDGTYLSSERSWQVVTGETEAVAPVQGLDAADFDGDGLAEIVVGDMSNAPFNIVYWLNASR